MKGHTKCLQVQYNQTLDKDHNDLPTAENKRKSSAAKDIIKPFQKVLCDMTVKLNFKVKNGQDIPGSTKCPYKAVDFDDIVSARQVQTLYSQAFESFNSWLA